MLHFTPDYSAAIALDSPSIQWFGPTNACTPRCRKKSSGPEPVRSDDFIVTLWYTNNYGKIGKTHFFYNFYIYHIYIYNII